jgi:hypothetical protein
MVTLPASQRIGGLYIPDADPLGHVCGLGYFEGQPLGPLKSQNVHQGTKSCSISPISPSGPLRKKAAVTGDRIPWPGTILQDSSCSPNWTPPGLMPQELGSLATRQVLSSGVCLWVAVTSKGTGRTRRKGTRSWCGCILGQTLRFPQHKGPHTALVTCSDRSKTQVLPVSRGVTIG